MLFRFAQLEGEQEFIIFTTTTIGSKKVLFQVFFNNLTKVAIVFRGRYTSELLDHDNTMEFGDSEEVLLEDLESARKDGWRIQPSCWKSYPLKGRVARNLLA